jgi:multidrug/hemolysin transport system ATP-binding protein
MYGLIKLSEKLIFHTPYPPRPMVYLYCRYCIGGGNCLAKIIEVSDLAKSYKDVKAVRGIDFYVEEGTLFAFLGPNGAGKSTTIDMICTLLLPDGGSVWVNGFLLGRDDDKIRSSIGVVFQSSVLDALLTVRENMETRGGLYGIKGERLAESIAKAAAAAEAEEFLDRRYGKLSGGQRRRADIARSLVNTPRILFLDEPTTGLDPQTRKSVWDTIRRLQKEEGVTVFLTTHYMEEAANADYVAVIDGGLITAKGAPAELREKYSSDYLKISPTDMEAIQNRLEEGGVEFEVNGTRVDVKLEKTLDALPLLKMCEGLINSFEVISGSMDDAFIAITGGSVKES